MANKFSEILKNIGKDILTDDSKTAIMEAFEQAVKEKADSVVKIEVDSALAKLDEKHSKMLTELLEAVDTDHTIKAKKVFAKIDSDYAEKLESVVNKYEGMINEEAIKFRDQLITEMSNFIELYIDEKIPKEQISEAVSNTHAKKLIENIKKIVSVDEEYITDNIKEALTDGKREIDTLRNELNEAVKSNIVLNQDMKKVKTEKFLMEKTMNFDDAKKHYVMRVLENKSPDEVEGNFDYVVKMFEKEENHNKQLLKESAVKTTKSNSVDTPKADVKEDVILESKQESPVDGYLSELKYISGTRK